MDASLWVTDGDVTTIVPWGNTIYIGGTFGYVGPNTGGWTETDGVFGQATTLLPRLDGDVTAMVSDGGGGWYIGGSFQHVAGIARPGLARILANGSVDPWTPSPAPTGNVTCLERAGGRVFVATDTDDLVAIDDATGAAIGSWNPAIVGTVSSMAVHGTTLFAAGDLSFASTSGTGTGIAAVNTSTGAIDDWDPAPDAPVTKVLVQGRWLFVTGTFFDIGGQPHSGLARALLTTRVFDSAWNPSIDQPATAMATANNGFWIGGEFFLVGAEFRDRIALVDTTTGATLPMQPDITGGEGPVTAILMSGTNAYLGFSPLFGFPTVGAAKPLVLKVGIVNGKLDRDFRVLGVESPTAGVGSVSVLKPSPAGIVAAGGFVSAGGRQQVCVAALDRGTGIPRTWNTGISIDELFPIFPTVSAIVPTNHAIYIGGYFTHAGGQARKSVAAIDSITGKAQPWQADLGPVATQQAGTAKALALFQDKLLVGGAFSTIKSVAHAGLALVDTVAGTPVSGWNVAGTVNRLLVQGTTAYVGGAFTSVGGQSRNHLAAVNASTGAVLAFNPNVAGNAVQALAYRADTLYVGGDYSQVTSSNRICLAAVNATTGALFGWSPSAFGPVRALAIDGPSILVGGEFSLIAGQPQGFLGRLDRFTGALGTGTLEPDGNILSLALDGGSLYMGGSFGKLNLATTAYLARVGGVESAGPSVAVVVANGGESLVVGTTHRLEYTASDPSGVASVDIELSRTGTGGPFVMLAAGMRNIGHYDWLVTGPAVAANAFLRVTARDFGGNLANDKSNAAFSIGPLVAGVDPTLDRTAPVSLSIGPNPARLLANLRLTLQQPTRARFRLLDVQGREVWGRPEQSYDAGEHVLPCDLAGVRPGLYFLRFEHGGRSSTTRLAVFR